MDDALQAIGIDENGNRGDQAKQSPLPQGANSVVGLHDGLERKSRGYDKTEYEAPVQIYPDHHQQSGDQGRRAILLPGAQHQEGPERKHRPGQEVRTCQHHRNQDDVHRDNRA